MKRKRKAAERLADAVEASLFFEEGYTGQHRDNLLIAWRAYCQAVEGKR